MNRVLELKVNTAGRDFVVGDIHGRYDSLMSELSRIEFDYFNDRLIAVGDLVDRGDQNLECLKLIFENWFYTVIGNHEVMMADGVTERQQGYTGRNLTEFWTTNGGNWYYDLDENQIEILKDIYAPIIYNQLPVAIELTSEEDKRVGIVHAGLPNHWSWTQTRKHLQGAISLRDIVLQNCLWTRNRINNTQCDTDIIGLELMITGHTPSMGHVWRGNNVFIDTGVYDNNKLTVHNVMHLLEEYNERRNK